MMVAISTGVVAVLTVHIKIHKRNEAEREIEEEEKSVCKLHLSQRLTSGSIKSICLVKRYDIFTPKKIRLHFDGFSFLLDFFLLLQYSLQNHSPGHKFKIKNEIVKQKTMSIFFYEKINLSNLFKSLRFIHFFVVVFFDFYTILHSN